MSLPAQTSWRWDRGILHCSVEYSTATGDVPAGTLTWIEEIAPEDDDRGNGSHQHSSQTLAEFSEKGPPSEPPVAIVESLLAALAPAAKEPSWLGTYRLLQAVKEGNAAAVGQLLAAGVPPDGDLQGLTPFYWAISQKNLTLAEILFAAGIEVNRRFPGSQETILMALAYHDETWAPLTARIVAQGADLEARKAWGETALIVAAGSSKRWLLPLLLKAGADVNAVSKHGYTALANAVSSRYLPVENVQLLLRAGAAVNSQDAEGWSPLMRAISTESVEAVRCLLAAGAQVRAATTPQQKNREPQTVLQLAIAYAHPEILALVRRAAGAWGTR